jgi:hypothetical protein
MSIFLEALGLYFSDFLGQHFGEKLAKKLSSMQHQDSHFNEREDRGGSFYKKTDYRNDPVYQKTLQRLIERNRKFEEERNNR